MGVSGEAAGDKETFYLVFLQIEMFWVEKKNSIHIYIVWKMYPQRPTGHFYICGCCFIDGSHQSCVAIRWCNIAKCIFYF